MALTDATLAIRDAFARSLSSGWGAAETGGAYTASGDGTLSVANGSSAVQVDPGAQGVALLGSTALRDAVLEYTLAVDRFPTTGELVEYTLVRATGPDTAYRLGLHLTAAGTIYASVEALLDGGAQRLAPSVAVTSAPTPSGVPVALRVRVEVMGGDPTQIRLRAWPASEPEPAVWHIDIIDWNGALQDRSSLGLGWRFEGDSVGGATVSFSNLSAWDTSEGAQ